MRLISWFTVLCLLLSISAYSQTIKGTIIDTETGEALFGVAVIVKDTDIGTTTDFDGNFELDPRTVPPFTLQVSYLGYEDTFVEITSANLQDKLKVKLKSAALRVEAVEVAASRISEKQLETPLTVESMNLAAIKETPSSSFYNGLGNLKGVDLTTASLGFVVINTRGFNSTRPVRSLQLVDGADNQAPGLNFSLGNFVGATELDIQKVDLIVGASSALYGPNAFNGVINMETKNPFFHRGLSVMVKGGERNLFESAIRYARKFSTKSGRDVFAFKVNFSYLRADDWEADNMAQVEGTLAGENNLGGYDAVNRYGDENLRAGSNNFIDQRISFPGLGRIYRTGYDERDLVDYNTRNYKAGAGLFYRPKDDWEVSYNFNFGAGTTVYQGDNRYSLKGLKFYQHRLEINKKDKFFIRAYYTQEDAGDSYDAVFTALIMQEQAKTGSAWTQDYSSYWSGNIKSKVQSLPGYPNPNDPLNPEIADLWFGDTRDSIIAVADAVLAQYEDSLRLWHSQARSFADSASLAYVDRFEPGTARFDSLKNEVTSRNSFAEGGSRFYDKSALAHTQAEYKFKVPFVDFTLGSSYRIYLPDSRGTIFSDTSGTRITNQEFGTYLGATSKLMEDRLVLSATARLDKNENFKAVASPAASAVYKYNKTGSFRLSFSSAIRNPTLQDQYLYYNLGRAILIGNLNGFQNLVTTESYFASLDGIALVTDSLQYFDVDPVRPEKVKTLEFGYKATLGKRVFIDASYYYNWYTDFLGFKIGADVEIDTTIGTYSSTQFYRVSANSKDMVTTQGAAIGITYGFGKYYALSGNYSWNRLDRRGSDDEIIPAYNTPEHKFNVGISGRDIVLKLGNATIKNWGFNVNYKWIQGFLFEGSPQFTGSIPSYGLLDAQINYKWVRSHLTFKLGATNLLNNQVFQTYGGPRVGRLAYVSILFEFDKI